MPSRTGKDYVPLVVLGRRPAERRGLAPLPGPRQGQGAAAAGAGRPELPVREPLAHDGPTLLACFGLYKPTTSAKAVADAIQDEIEKIATAGVPAADLARVKTKMRSDFYSGLELPIYRADVLALAQLLTGTRPPSTTCPAQIDAVTSADLQRVAATYLTVANRTVVDRKPAAAAAAEQKRSSAMKKTMLLASLLAARGALAPGLAAAEKKPLPKDLPPFGEDKPLPVPSIAQSKLPNGLTVWVVKRGGFPRVGGQARGARRRRRRPEGRRGHLRAPGRHPEGRDRARAPRGRSPRSCRRWAPRSAPTPRPTRSTSPPPAWARARPSCSRWWPTSRATPSFPAAEVELAKGNALQGLEARESTPEFLAQKALAPGGLRRPSVPRRRRRRRRRCRRRPPRSSRRSTRGASGPRRRCSSWSATWTRRRCRRR